MQHILLKLQKGLSKILSYAVQFIAALRVGISMDVDCTLGHLVGNVENIFMHGMIPKRQDRQYVYSHVN